MNTTVDIRRMVRLSTAVLVLGVGIGAASGLLAAMLPAVERLAMGYVEQTDVPGPFHVPAVRRLLSVVLGAACASVIWWLLRTRAKRVPSVTQAVHGESMPWWQTTVHVLLQVFIVGTGSSIGREVAPREFGAMLGQYYGRAVKLNEADRRTIVAICAGAGLAGVYNAPLAGLFFAVEILLADVRIEKVSLAFAVSTIAAYTASLIKGDHVFYQLVGLPQSTTASLMVFSLIAGAVCGVAGAAFRKATQWAQAGPRNDAGLLWRMPLAAAFTGVLAIALPQVMGNGRAAAQLAFNTSLIAGLQPGIADMLGRGGLSPTGVTVIVLVLALCAKTLATLLTIRSGASGGVLQPAIAVGSTLGAILGVGWALWFPADSVSACALIGAAALLAASQQAPLMALCLVMELCSAPISFMVPAGVAVAVSSLLSSLLVKRSANGVSRSQRK